jgi:hypothetical protein
MSTEKEIAIRKLSKRILNLVQELELASLDISQNSIPLSKGLFPNAWAKETNKAFLHWTTEMQRIANNWGALFKEQIEAPEEPKPAAKITRRKK